MAKKTSHARSRDRKTPPAPGPGRPGIPALDHPRGQLIAATLITLAALAAVGFYRIQGGSGYPLDDSWIHLTYARNIATGNGFGANPHEATPGATSPLWVVLLAPGFWLGDVHAWWPWLVATIALAATGLLCSRLVVALREVNTARSASVRSATARRLPLTAITCGLAVVWTGPLVWSAAGAMEVPLFTALVTGSILVFVRRPAGMCRTGLFWGLLAGIAALSRPEGLLLFPLMAGAAVLRSRRRGLIEALAGGVACAIVYSPSVLFCLISSGRIFPNTFYAKTTSLVAGAPDAAFLEATARFLATNSPVTLVAFLIGVATLISGALARRFRVDAALVAAFTVGLPLAYAAMGRTFLFANLAGNFGRYLYPMFPPALVLGFWGVGWTWERLGRSGWRWLIVSLLALAMVGSAAETLSRAKLYRRNVADIDSMQVTLALRLKERLEPGTLVAANDVGAIAYFTGFRILDLVGIISTQTLDALERAGTDPMTRQRAVYQVIQHERPAVLVVFPEWYRAMLEAMADGLDPITSTYNPDNITSGGYRLVAYAVHWDRL